MPEDSDDLKTGMRRIRIVEAAPFVNALLNAHPLAHIPDAPLFLSTHFSALPVYKKAAEERAARENGGHAPSLTPDDLERVALSRSGMARIGKKAARLAGIRKHLTPKSFRHGRATFLSARGVPESILRLRFGWSPTSNTPAVYQHLSGVHEDLALFRALGVRVEEEETKPSPLASRKCLHGHKNGPSVRCCHQFGSPLDVTAIASNPGATAMEFAEALKDPAFSAAMCEWLAQ